MLDLQHFKNDITSTARSNPTNPLFSEVISD